MSERFSVRKVYRNDGILCLVFSTGLLCLSVYLGMTETRPELRGQFFFFAIGFCGGLDVLGFLYLFQYRREKTVVDERSLRMIGVLTTREIDFSEVVDAQWKVYPLPGRLVLKTLTGKVRIKFGKFEQERRGSLIRILRGSLPESVQRGWSLFCYKVAIPETKPVDREPEEGEVRYTRRMYDWIFLSVFIVLVVAAFVEWKLSGYEDFLLWIGNEGWELAFVLIIPVVIWIKVRYSTPAQGVVRKKIPLRDILYLWLSMFLFYGLLIVINRIYAKDIFNGDKFVGWSVVAVGTVLFVMLIVSCIKDNLRNRRRDREAADGAVEEWDAMVERGG